MVVLVPFRATFLLSPVVQWWRLYLSNPFYSCENWFLNDAVLNLLHSLLGELSKWILRLPKWYSNTAAMVVLDWGSARARCLERKLCFLHRITKDLDTATDRLSSHMFCALSDTSNPPVLSGNAWTLKTILNSNLHVPIWLVCVP